MDRLPKGLLRGEDGRVRCAWAGDLPLYVDYHDREWGVPVADDHRLFEKICLEGFQSGLSWITILRKRERFREVFAAFDIERVARFGARERARLLLDPGIVRHRGKIEATLSNARAALALRDEAGSLARYFWSHEPPPRPGPMTWAALRTRTPGPEAAQLSKDLRRRGWRFVGPTTAYAFMQAMGLVNDHLDGCFRRAEVEGLRRRFKRPQPARSGAGAYSRTGAAGPAVRSPRR